MGKRQATALANPSHRNFPAQWREPEPHRVWHGIQGGVIQLLEAQEPMNVTTSDSSMRFSDADRRP